MGDVWLAEDTRLDRQVALKMVRAEGDPSSRARLMKEARAAAALNHPHIATVHDVLEHDGEIIVVFEYVEGETLQARIARGAIPAPEAVDIAMQIAKALVGAHANGIVHRDLKPANVIIGADGHVKVLDFGIARILSRGTTLTNPGAQPQTASLMGFVGTASYAAPEQMVSSAVDERADLYALGVVLFEMISGERPFVGHDPVQLATKKLGTDAPRLSSTGRLVPPVLERIVASLLQREADRRPQSAAEVLGQLKHVFGGDSTVFLQPSRTGGALIAIAASILIVLLGGFGAWQWMKPRISSARAGAAPVIAVLPLTNVSGDPAKDYVAAGIAESLTTSLATVPSVTVLSRVSVAEARNRTSDFKGIVKELGANYLVEGGVQQSGDIVRVSLSLVRPDKTVAWADSVEARLQDIFALQSRLAAALSSAIEVRVSDQDRQRMEKAPTANPDALSAYWQGTALLDRADVKGNVDLAIAAFERALTFDPKFALARTGLSSSYRRKYLDMRDPEWAQRAIDEASNALRLDQNLPEVRYALGVTLASSGRLDDAIDELNRALALRPNYEDARRQLGQVLAQQGQIDAAVAEFRKAIALRPTSPMPYSAMGLALYGASRYTEAAAAFEEGAKVAPDSYLPYQQLGTVYQALGRVDDALASYRKSLAIRPSAGAYSNTGALLHQKGDFAGAVDAYRQAIAIRSNSAATHRNLGDALLRLGKGDEARKSYAEAVRLGEADLKVNPTDARTLAAQAVYLQKAGQPQAAAARINDALKRAPTNADVLYRSAVVQVLSGDKDAALKFLASAVANGYSRKAVEVDDDWTSLRRDARFTQVVSGDAK
jgi:tetratricopeptide (TPR) repeat protein